MVIESVWFKLVLFWYNYFVIWENDYVCNFFMWYYYDLLYWWVFGNFCIFVEEMGVNLVMFIFFNGN